jgi:hypothetical protein
MVKTTEASIIALDRFIQATRDSGYKGTYSAVSELVDNSLQAGAKHVRINIFAGADDPHCPIRIAALDDGCGMDRVTLRQALRFGGSSRFNDREGLGRYGMGLPNSSLSQSKKVEVFTWQNGGKPIYSYLDVDEIASGQMTEVPRPQPKAIPASFAGLAGKSGTLVLWSRCDRLSNGRISTIARKLHKILGRIYRYFIWSGSEIVINGEKVQAWDPLFLQGQNGQGRASMFGEPICYEVEAPASNGDIGGIGKITVTFSELPVHDWHGLTNEEKRRRGVANGAGVSIVRANREVDFGWFFLGEKRRENYDDWWRCEIRFDPILDEAFGITHTKQQIRPQEYLTEILSPDVETMAKALNGRVRSAHLRLKEGERSRDAEEIAAKKDRLLEPLPTGTNLEDERIANEITREHRDLKADLEQTSANGLEYRICTAKMRQTLMFCCARKNGHLVLVLNPDHPFYREVYEPLTNENRPDAQEVKRKLDLVFLAAARAEAMTTRKPDRESVKKYRKNWSDILATFLSH